MQLCLQTLGFPCVMSAPDPHCTVGLSNNAMTPSSSMGSSSLVQATQAQHSDQVPPDNAVAAKIKEMEDKLVQYQRLQELTKQLAKQERFLKRDGVLTRMQEQGILAKQDVKEEFKPINAQHVVKRELDHPGEKHKIHINLLEDEDEPCPTVPSGHGFNELWSERWSGDQIKNGMWLESLSQKLSWPASFSRDACHIKSSLCPGRAKACLKPWSFLRRRCSPVHGYPR